MLVRIPRVCRRDDGVLGSLIIDNWPVCCTLELPWKDNLPEVSCIPAGVFTGKRVNSPKFGNTFEVTNVPNRSHILFHGANTIADLLGCIGLAEFFHSFSGRTGIANPTKGAAMKEFLERTAEVNEFKLIITEHF